MTISDAGTFLTKILDHKRAEVARQAIKIPLEQLQESLAAAPPPRPFDAALRQPGRVALIAEVKKASPSKGVLVENFDPLALARIYAENGAAAISVLTDVRFFQGSLKYLEGIRSLLDSTTDHRPPTTEDRGSKIEDSTVAGGETPSSILHPPSSDHSSVVGRRSSVVGRPVPVLRKDFIIDPYQVYEARAYGADALLLIVAALDDRLLAELHALTHELGMQALIEVHDEAELERALALGAALIGVNNRNLHTFVTNLETTRRLAARLPAEGRPLLISESAIATAADVARVRAWGVDAVLVGEALVTAPDVAGRVRELASG